MSDHSDPDPKKKVLFLFSDTGGGHRAPTEAMIDAMEREFPGRFEPTMIDFFRQYYPRPLKYAPELYPPISRVPKAWDLSYRASNGRGRSRAVTTMTYPYIRGAIARLLEDNPADMVVSVHPLVNQAMMRAMRHAPRPYITVVTDLVSTHAFWFDRRADLVVVPTEQAERTAVGYGIPAGNLRVIGLPVREAFRHQLDDRVGWRERHGWGNDRPVILLASGGDGMGPVKRVATAINDAGLDATLVIVCGRNAELKAELARVSWRMPTQLVGFTDEMPAFMAAADIVVTKAGAGSISEAFACGLPIIIYARLAGQEDGNVSYVVEQGAGVWAPHPRDVVDALRAWIDDPHARELVSAASAALARPDAARQIVRVIADELGIR